MNRQALLFLLLILFASAAQAKDAPLPYSVKGILVDSLTMEGEPYSTLRIALKSDINKPVKVNVTGLNGEFNEQLKSAGTYVISFSTIGRTTVAREFTLSDAAKSVDLGKILMSESSEMLKGVEVVAAKPLVKSDIDKIEYSIKDDPESETNTMLEMLRKVPLVTVDGEDKIQVNGSSNFAVHVNGKPNSMLSKNPSDVLKSMPASTIKKIEVITDPGAKYDAEGISGILNIVTDDNSRMQGYNVTTRVNIDKRRLGGSLFGTVQIKKFTLSANYSYNKQNGENNYSTMERETFNNDNYKYLTSDGKSKSSGAFQFGQLEGSYEIDTLNLISFSAGLWGYNFKDHSLTGTLMRNNLLEQVYSFNNRGNSKNSNTNLNVGFDYQRTFKEHKDRMLTFSYRLNHTPGNIDSYSDYEDVVDYPYTLRDLKYLTDNKSDEHTFQLDFTTPFGKLHTLSTGVKYILRQNHSITDSYYDNKDDLGFVFDETSSTDFKQQYDIYAAYGEYKLKYKKFSAKAGVRYEYSKMGIDYNRGDVTDFDTDFSDLVPSASLGWKLNETQNFSLTYNMRISRPDIYYLNPYVDKSNPTSISYGNPDLDSEKAHSFDLKFGNFSPKFSLNMSLGYRFVNNGIEQYAFMEKDETGNSVQYSTFENIGKSKVASLSAYFNWSMTKTTRVFANMGGRYSEYKSEEMDLSNSGWSGNLFGGIQQTLPHDIRLSLNAGGSTKNVRLQGNSSGFSFYSLSANRSFMKEKRLTVSLYCNNVFSHYHTFSSDVTTADFHSKSGFKVPMRSFGFSISYRLGKLQAQVKKASHSISNDDVKAGGSSNQTSGSTQTGN